MVGLTTPAYKSVFGGTVSGIQTWSCSLWLARTGGSAPSQHDVTVNAGAISAEWQAWFTGAVKGINHAPLTAESTSLYYYPAGAISAALLGVDEFTHIAANGATDRGPSQLSLVTSLRSSTPGRSGRARFYVPLTETAQLTGGQVSNALVSSLAVAAQTLLQGLNAIAPSEGGAFGCCVASFTKGVAEPIVSIVVDSKIDTQRRREDKIGPSFVAVAEV